MSDKNYMDLRTVEDSDDENDDKLLKEYMFWHEFKHSTDKLVKNQIIPVLRSIYIPKV